MTNKELVERLRELPAEVVVSVWAQDKVFGIEECAAITVKIGGGTDVRMVRIVTAPFVALQEDEADG